MADTKDAVEVASIAVFDGAGDMLWGRRRDNGRWTLPGGHLEDGEGAYDGAVRELKEETGLQTEEILESLGADVVESRDRKIRVHAYQVTFHDEEKPRVTTEEDPDNECSEWRWVNVSDGLPKEIGDNLHSPRNVTLRLLGMQDWEPEADGLAKHDTPEFQEWFAGSHVKDPQGKPLKLYHGTSKDADFSSFKIGKRGAWFTNDPKEASMYAVDNDSRGPVFSGGQIVDRNNAPRVMPVHLSIKNPYVFQPQDVESHQMAPNYAKWQAAFFDGLRIKGHDGVDFGNGTWVAFHPHQIKSVFNARPSLHSNIMKSEGIEKSSGLAEWCGSNESYGVLDQTAAAGSSWHAGGCNLLARAIQKKHPEARLVGIQLGDDVHHVGARIGDTIHDAYGDHAAGEWAAKWLNNEQIHTHQPVSVVDIQHQKMPDAESPATDADIQLVADALPTLHLGDSHRLEKGLKEKALAAAIGLGGLGLGFHGRTPEPQAVTAPTAAPAAAPVAPPPKAEPSQWTPEGLHPGLHPVAQLESSFGKNIQHAAHSKGPFHTAHGAVGFKPVSGYDQYQNSKALQAKYPGLDKETFTAKFRSDHKFYNEVASDHWQWLQDKLKTPERTAYGWRWGRGAAIKATPQQIAKSGYVKEYMKTMQGMKAPAKVQIKPRTLKKMAYEVAQGHMRPHRASQYEGGLQSVETYQVPHNQRPPGEQSHAREKPLYHHVVKHTPYDHGGYAVTHILSYDKEPTGFAVSSSAATVRGDGAVEHGETATHASAQGTGYGTLLYRRMLRYHGKMRSDSSVSPTANKVWDKILATPGVTGAKGAPETPEKHYAQTSEVWDEKPVASTMLNGYSFHELDEALDNPDKRFITENDFSGRPITRLYSVAGGNIPHVPDAQEALDSYGPYRETFLRKMALKDIPVGQKIDTNTFDYNHLLTPEHLSQGLSLRVMERHGLPAARLYDAEGKQVGTAAGGIDRKTLNITNTFLHRGLRRQGLGAAMYEALLAHAKNHLGLRSVAGEEHSTAASRTHQQLAQKHGMSYNPEYKSGVKTGEDYDDRAGPYSYLLKAEKPIGEPTGNHEFWKALKTKEPAHLAKQPMGVVRAYGQDEFWQEPAHAGAAAERLKKMDFVNRPPPKIDPSFIPKHEDFAFPHQPSDIRAAHNKAMRAASAASGDLRSKAIAQVHADTLGKWGEAFDHAQNLPHIQRLRRGLAHVTGINEGGQSLPLTSVGRASGEQLGANVGGVYVAKDGGGVKVHDKHAGRFMESLGGSAAFDLDAHHDHWSVVMHELFHSVSHRDHDYESRGKGMGPQAAMEEATTEIPARHYSHDIAFSHLLPPAATAEEDQKRREAKHFFHFADNGEVDAKVPMAYTHNCAQFARLVAFAHRREIDGDNERLNNAVVNHALLAKRSPSRGGGVEDARLGNLISLIMMNNGMEPKSAMGWNRGYESLHDNLKDWLISDGTSKHLDEYLKTAQKEYQKGKAIAASYGEP